MIDLLLRSALLLAATALIAALAGGAGASAAIRHRIWLLGIGAVLAMPLLMAAMPSVELPILPPAETGAPAAVSPQAVEGSPFWLILYLSIAATLTGRLFLGRSRAGEEPGARRSPRAARLGTKRSPRRRRRSASIGSSNSALPLRRSCR